jgi:ribosomal RNA-processing protein 36
LAHGKTVSRLESNYSSSKEGSDDESEARDLDPKGKQKGKPEWSIKPRTDLAKRSSKHA